MEQQLVLLEEQFLGKRGAKFAAGIKPGV